VQGGELQRRARAGCDLYHVTAFGPRQATNLSGFCTILHETFKICGKAMFLVLAKLDYSSRPAVEENLPESGFGWISRPLDWPGYSPPSYSPDNKVSAANCSNNAPPIRICSAARQQVWR
jgi:hypothetical protein